MKLIVMVLRNITLMCEFAREKCYYLKIIDLFREIIKLTKEKKRMELENFKLLFRSKKIIENIYQYNGKMYFFCEKFNYAFEQFCKLEVHNPQYPNNTWRIYLNQNEYGYELEHI